MMKSIIDEQPVENQEYDMKVFAKSPNGDGISKLGKFVVFIKNSKTKIGSKYKIKITKIYRTYATGEINYNTKQYIGNSLIEL